jgi:hypothetical protein
MNEHTGNNTKNLFGIPADYTLLNPRGSEHDRLGGFDRRSSPPPPHFHRAPPLPIAHVLQARVPNLRIPGHLFRQIAAGTHVLVPPPTYPSFHGVRGYATPYEYMRRGARQQAPIICAARRGDRWCTHTSSL